MKDLDFLPASYWTAIHRRRQNRRNALLSAGLFLALASLHALNSSRLRTAQAALRALENGSGGWRSARDQLAELEQKRALYQQQAALVSKLDDAAPLDAAIGEVSRLLNESMAIRSLTVESAGPPAAGTANPAGPGPAPAAASALPPPVTRACLIGVAATDVDVGIFLGKLGACPLFGEVSMSYTRPSRAAGRLMREFEVKFIIKPVVEGAS